MLLFSSWHRRTGASGNINISEANLHLYRVWEDDEIRRAVELKERGKSYSEIADEQGRTYEAIRLKFQRNQMAVPKSPMPLWNSPLESTGDAVILSDIEAPFQHSEFINRVLALADAWNITDLHLDGDLLHYDSLSMWGSEWTEQQEDIRDTFLDIVKLLDVSQREQAVRLLEDKGVLADAGYTGEMKAAREMFKSFGQFKNIYVALGNHDDRYLRTLNQALAPSELLHQLDVKDDSRWKIAPYYYTLIHTEGGTFRATHPRGAGKNTAIDLAVQFHQHIIMGHSHRWSINRDPSANFWAIQTGHCVDEDRLAYVKQRDAKRDAHMNGATIIRGGYPFVLHMDSPWELLKRM